jgi:hypothetical protein
LNDLAAGMSRAARCSAQNGSAQIRSSPFFDATICVRHRVRARALRPSEPSARRLRRALVALAPLASGERTRAWPLRPRAVATEIVMSQPALATGLPQASLNTRGFEHSFGPIRKSKNVCLCKSADANIGAGPNTLRRRYLEMPHIRIRFNETKEVEWKQHAGGKKWDFKPIPANAGPLVVAGGSVVFYAWSLDTVVEQMKTFTPKVQVQANHQIRYEYWKTSTKPQSWSLNNPTGMKKAALAEALYHVHRIVICDEADYKMITRGSHVVLKIRDYASAPFPKDIVVKELADILPVKIRAIKGAGVGTIVEEALLDVVSFLF